MWVIVIYVMRYLEGNWKGQDPFGILGNLVVCNKELGVTSLIIPLLFR